jgi:hypothetical protein
VTGGYSGLGRETTRTLRGRCGHCPNAGL